MGGSLCQSVHFNSAAWWNDLAIARAGVLRPSQSAAPSARFPLGWIRQSAGRGLLEANDGEGDLLAAQSPHRCVGPYLGASVLVRPGMRSCPSPSWQCNS